MNHVCPVSSSWSSCAASSEVYQLNGLLLLLSNRCLVMSNLFPTCRRDRCTEMGATVSVCLSLHARAGCVCVWFMSAHLWMGPVILPHKLLVQSQSLCPPWLSAVTLYGHEGLGKTLTAVYVNTTLMTLKYNIIFVSAAVYRNVFISVLHNGWLWIMDYYRLKKKKIVKYLLSS